MPRSLRLTGQMSGVRDRSLPSAAVLLSACSEQELSAERIRGIVRLSVAILSLW